MNATKRDMADAKELGEYFGLCYQDDWELSLRHIAQALADARRPSAAKTSQMRRMMAAR